VALSKAIERARDLYNQVHQHAAAVPVLANAWGIKETTGTLWTTAASLLQYGLLTDEGTGEKRKFQLTDTAFRILLDPDPGSEKRRTALQKVATSPKIHTELWERFKDASQVSDALLKGYLTLDRREEGKAPYSDAAAHDVIRVYRDAISFAGLSNSSNIASTYRDSEAGLTQISIKEEPEVEASTSPQVSLRRGETAGQHHPDGDLFDGERQLTSGMLSRGASYRLIVSGRIGVKEIDTLIRKLEIDKEILAQPDEN
jgi:hypothetical protein